MKHSCFIRKIDELGRVVLPIEIRQNLEIKEKDPLEIFLEDGGIFIKKYRPSCIFCDSTKNLKNLSDKSVCQNCINKIKGGNFFIWTVNY